MAKAMSATLIFAAVSMAACGSSSNGSRGTSSSATSTAASAPAAPLTAPPGGAYTASMTTKGLEAAGVVVRDVGNSGTWHMSLSAKKVSLKPPFNGPIVYAVVSVTKRTLTLGPNPECSTAKGRSQKSVYTESQVGGGVQFKAVHFACPEDGGAITAGIWKKG